MRKALTLLLFFAFLLAAAPAAAQNLMANDSFESGLASWPASAGSVGTASPEGTTVHFGAGSVSIAISGTAGFSSVEQCVAVTPGQSYNWGGWSYVPSGQDGSNQAQVYWCTTSACTTCNFSVGAVSSTLTNAWEKLMVSGSVAPAAPFAKLVLRSIANTSSPFTSYFDDAFFGIGVVPVELVRFAAD